MRLNEKIIIARIRDLGATNCMFIPSSLLRPDLKIRNYCVDNRCGCYGKHLMCPPNTGTINEADRKFSCFKTCILIQYARPLDVQKDPEGLAQTKRKLHHIVLETEKYFRRKLKHRAVWGLIGGTCALCEECAGFQDEPCPYPEKARTSLEALGIDVMSLLENLGLDNGFYDDRITWTGMVLSVGPV